MCTSSDASGALALLHASYGAHLACTQVQASVHIRACCDAMCDRLSPRLHHHKDSNGTATFEWTLVQCHEYFHFRLWS